MSLLLALAGAVVEPPEPPEPDPFYAVGGGRRGPMPTMLEIEQQAMQEAAARDMQDIQDIVAALFVFGRIF
jgi:hypothetical protein